MEYISIVLGMMHLFIHPLIRLPVDFNTITNLKLVVKTTIRLLHNQICMHTNLIQFG